MTRNTSPTAPSSYAVLAVHPDSFDPFGPDALGALREAYAWIANPTLIGNGEMIYSTARYNDLVAMMGRALSAAQVPA
jgi:hypothetical protein